MPTLPSRYTRLDTTPRTLLYHYIADGTLVPRIGPTAQLTAPAAGGYLPNANGRLVQTPYGAPAMQAVDLDGDGVLDATGWMIEAARTNSALRSQEFDNASWNKADTTVTANAWRAPDGTLTADKVVEAATSASHYISQTVTAGTDNWVTTNSVYARAGERSWLWCTMRRKDNTIVTAWFDLVNGVVGTVASGAEASITQLADGWCRCEMRVNVLAGATNTTVSYGPTTGDNTSTYLGDTTKGIYLWGAQVEVDRAFASSYIPTTTTTVTRTLNTVRLTPTWPLQDCTIYVKLARVPWVDSANSLGSANHHTWVHHWGRSDNSYFRSYFDYSAGLPREARVSVSPDGVASATAVADTIAGSVVELCMQHTDLLRAPSIRIDAGGGFGASAVSTIPFSPEATWTLGYLGGDGIGDRRLFTPLLEYKVAAGALTMAQMRGAR